MECRSINCHVFRVFTVRAVIFIGAVALAVIFITAYKESVSRGRGKICYGAFTAHTAGVNAVACFFAGGLYNFSFIAVSLKVALINGIAVTAAAGVNLKGSLCTASVKAFCNRIAVPRGFKHFTREVAIADRAE